MNIESVSTSAGRTHCACGALTRKWRKQRAWNCTSSYINNQHLNSFINFNELVSPFTFVSNTTARYVRNLRTTVLLFRSISELKRNALKHISCQRQSEKSCSPTAELDADAVAACVWQVMMFEQHMRASTLAKRTGGWKTSELSSCNAQIKCFRTFICWSIIMKLGTSLCVESIRKLWSEAWVDSSSWMECPNK